jgi:hypothetical protein
MCSSFSQRFRHGAGSALLSLLCLSSRASAQAGAPASHAPASHAPASHAPAAPSAEKAACIAAFDQAQRDSAASKLLSSQKELLQCSRPACGNALMGECTQMYTEIERALPSVVLSAHDEALDIDLTAVQVTLDGRPFARSLDGRPLPLDPGEYVFTFTAPGYPPITRSAVIGTGDKYRLINVVFPASDASLAPVTRSTGATPSATARAPERGVPVMTYVLGGVGVAGVGTFGALRIIANGDFDALKKGCAPTCPASDVASVRQKYVLSNAALGVGAGALLGAVLWYVFDSGAGVRAEAGVSTGLELARGGALASARGRF